MPVFKDHSFRFGASSQGDAVYSINQSIRLSGADTTGLNRTPSSAGNTDKWTFSCWVKRGKLGQSGGGGSHQVLLSAGTSVSDFTFFGFRDSGSLPSGAAAETISFLVADSTNNPPLNLYTTQVFRDVSAWYHLVAVYDSGNDISSERAKIYVNGSRVTEFNLESYPSQDYDSEVNKTLIQRVGYFDLGNNKGHFDGYMSEIHLLDGYAYGPEYFGEFNSSNIWIPKKYDGGNYGTNGFYIKGSDSSALGTDSSGNGNDLTVVSGLAAHDQVTDTPNNNFCVMNPLADYYANHTFKNGNLELLTSTTTNQYTYSINNIGMSSGKWYVELYVGSAVGGVVAGISDRQGQAGTHYLGGQSYEYSYYHYNGKSINGGTQSAYGNTYTTGDIIGIALDLDNSKLYFSKNGTFQNSGVPTSGSTGTGAISITAVASTQNGNYFFAVGDWSNSYSTNFFWNFGQEGTFAGNTTAGGNSDGNGIGNFKYSVPSGYLALCTSNLFTG